MGLQERPEVLMDVAARLLDPHGAPLASLLRLSILSVQHPLVLLLAVPQLHSTACQLADGTGLSVPPLVTFLHLLRQECWLLPFSPWKCWALAGQQARESHARAQRNVQLMATRVLSGMPMWGWKTVLGFSEICCGMGDKDAFGLGSQGETLAA